MTAMTLPADSRAAIPPPATRTPDAWHLAGLALLSVRFIQGFIYWGGGSRRFIYAPSKLDPHSASWMANKFQSAMPGALLGTDHVISFLLHHFDLLYASLILFSAAELIAGVFLMAGLFTRAAALVSIGFSIALMLMFGWQGATCIDEWTMAASNLAMGATLMLAGGGAFSLDATWLQRRPALASRAWFRWATGARPLPLSDRPFRNVALAVFAATAVFNLATYNYYRGSVVTAFHGGPVSPAKHHIAVADVRLLPGGAVRFHAYLDGGTPAEPSNIMEVALLGKNGAVIEEWNGAALSHLPKAALANDYAYNRFAPGAFGLSAKMGAAATVTLPAPDGATAASATAATLRLRTVNGGAFEAPAMMGQAS
ncbi:MAG: TQO small subunit DoxD [Acetobacteraceae bacterium]|nr:TQO small subunit DoxD [Acetobacteraceae bacterium]